MIRPKCAIKECSNEALTLFAGKFICGECFLRIQKNLEKEIWGKENAS